ncbi:hypothetical protein [Flavicella sediminum]|uniref:hypothetical protein n=1 Tax=Flavicella sediminum TaxID=2585141 RepID=UPI00111DCCA2|nr:hypothetical protein [Flavicella sediminum]
MLKKIIYKFFVGFIFSLVASLSKLLFTQNETPFSELLSSQDFWVNYLIFFLLGYVLLGNILWMQSQKNKEINS